MFALILDSAKLIMMFVLIGTIMLSHYGVRGKSPHGKTIGYCATSIFTELVIVCQCFISPSSQALASASELFGTTLKFCFWSFSFASGDFRRLAHGSEQRVQHRLRRCRRREQAVPGHRADVGVSDFLHGRNVGIFREPCAVDHRERAEFAGLHLARG